MRRALFVAILALTLVGCGSTPVVTPSQTVGPTLLSAPSPTATDRTLPPSASLPPLPSPTPTPSPTAAPSVGALPACADGDVLTRFQDPGDWARTILDTTFRLVKGFVPPDLVSVSKAGIPGSAQVRSLVIADLAAMHQAAAQAGVKFGVGSGYRSYATQVKIFETERRQHGLTFALKSAARPGHSEHQLGTVIDVSGDTVWLSKHAWEYGWVQSYAKQWSPTTTCYKPEAWHLRYVGRASAAAWHASGVSLREWLWGTQPAL